MGGVRGNCRSSYWSTPRRGVHAHGLQEATDWNFGFCRKAAQRSAREQPGSRPSARFILEIDVGERLPVLVADDEADGVVLGDGPRRREAAGGGHGADEIGGPAAGRTQRPRLGRRGAVYGRVPCDLATLARWCAMTHTRHLVAVLILAVAIAGSAVGGPFEDGAAAIERGDYVTAMRLLRPLADQGVAKAQGMVGAIYEKGAGVPQDYAAAMSWYRRAADQGHALAQTSVGAMYALGEGVPQDYGEAIKWFRKAADQGEPHAEMKLGAAYELGSGVPQDSAAAARWFRKAADQGNAKSQRILGAMYADGRGVPQDYVAAHMWFNLAAAGGDKDATEFRDRVANLMTPAQIAEAQKLAREWEPLSSHPR
jgi:hypothetical protein